MATSPLNNFISLVKLGGLARTNRYTVLFSKFGDRTRDILLLCDQVQLPGTNFSTADMRTYGETRKAPYERLYEDVNMSFYVDTGLSVKKFFDDWQNLIQDPKTRNFNYYDSYTCDIVIEVQDLQNKSRYGIKLFEAFPKSIGSIQMDYAGKDVMKLSVNFAYKYYYVGETAQAPQGDAFYPYKFDGDTPASYQPIFNDTPSATQTKNDPLNSFITRLKDFGIGAAGSTIVTKLPGILKR